MDTDKTLLKQISEKAMVAQVNFFNPCSSVSIRGCLIICQFAFTD